MCGRYTLYGAEDLGERYKLAAEPQFVSRDNYNVAPRQRLPIVHLRDGERVAEVMQWGFLPFFAKDPEHGFRPINTVSETAFEKPMWRAAVKHHRCLVPARGFYEWKKTLNAVGKLERKVPYYIHPKDIGLFSFAGVYSIWKDVEGLPFYTFSIMTTTPNKEMAAVHNRMPVILATDQEAEWLDPDDDPARLTELLRPFPDGGLQMYPVSSDVNSPRNNDAHLMAPAPVDK